MQYLIVKDRNTKSLTEKIEKLLQEGWVLQGGVATATWRTTSEERQSYYDNHEYDLVGTWHTEYSQALVNALPKPSPTSNEEMRKLLADTKKKFG